MVNGITYKSDLTKIDHRLQSLYTGLSNPAMYAMMNTIHHYFTRKSDEMFQDGTDPYGSNWAPLKDVTVTIRENLGYGPKPINVRTGLMKRYFTDAKADILGHSDGAISYAYPKRAWPDKDMRWRLEQASGLIRGGPARRVVGLSGVDAAYVLGTMRKSILESVI